MRKILIILTLLYSIIPICVNANELKLAESAQSAILIEASTGEIIFEKNSLKLLSFSDNMI